MYKITSPVHAALGAALVQAWRAIVFVPLKLRVANQDTGSQNTKVQSVKALVVHARKNVHGISYAVYLSTTLESTTQCPVVSVRTV